MLTDRSTRSPAGTLLAGRYELRTELGRGGFGVVWEAVDRDLERLVAVKLLHPDPRLGPDRVERFRREALATGQLSNPHTVRVFDFGESELGRHIVMERLRGRDLDAEIRTRSAMRATVPEAVEWTLQAALGLAEAHGLGIVHRDVKLANLFLARSVLGDATTVKVCDFGLAQLAGSTAVRPELTGMTQPGSTAGSPRYMSPEQCRDASAVDARTDVWSLGVALYWLVAGCPPFPAESTYELLAQIIEGVFVPIHECRRDIPDGVAEAVAGLLTVDSASRWSLGRVATALGGLCPDPHLAARVKLAEDVASLQRARTRRDHRLALELAAKLMAEHDADTPVAELAAEVHLDAAERAFAHADRTGARALVHATFDVAKRSSAIETRAADVLDAGLTDEERAGSPELGTVLMLRVPHDELLGYAVDAAIYSDELRRAHWLARSAVQEHPSWRTYAALAHAELHHGRSAEALRAVDRAWDVSPRESDDLKEVREAALHGLRTEARALAGDLDAARDDLREAERALGPDSDDVVAARASVLAAERGIAAAVESIAASVDDPWSTPAWNALRRRLERRYAQTDAG